jgi:hypothetical protein
MRIATIANITKTEKNASTLGFTLTFLKSVFDYAVNGAETVSPAYFLAFLERSSVVAYADFVNSDFRYFRNLGRHFGFETESVFLEFDRFYDVGAEQLVTRFHVGQIEVRKHIAQKRKDAVSDAVPEEQDAVRFAAHETAAVDHVGVTVENRFEQDVVFLRIVLEIGVLDDDQLARGVFDSRAQSRAFSLVHLVLVVRNGQIGVCTHISFNALLGVVGAEVVDDDDFLFEVAAQFHSLDLVQNPVDGRAFVIRRDDDRKFPVRVCHIDW